MCRYMFLGGQYLVIHDHNRPVNVYQDDPKAETTDTCIIDAAITHGKPKTGHVVIFFINQATEMKGFDHHLLCPMQCFINIVVIDEVPKFLAPIQSKTMHAIQIVPCFDATHQIITPLMLNGVTTLM